MNIDNLILIIDDELQIRRLLEITLSASDYKICEAGSGKEGIAIAASQNPSLIILDLGLPDISGFDVLKHLREWYQKPIIILSVRSSEEDIVRALDNGANDYLTKPFRTGELLARVRSLLRRNMQNEQEPVMKFADIEIDLINHSVRKNNDLLKLTATEFSLLTLLARNAGRVLTHQYLLKEVWGMGYVEQSQYLRVFVAQLRKKIEDNPASPKLLITESGIGYRFSD